MKSIFRIYAKTSKGNDNYLLKQLNSFNIKPKYDQHLNSFYFNSTWENLFDVSFRCLTVEQMYIQIGQNFKMVDEQQITGELQRLPFKNYIPIQRGLIENTTLKIFMRESIHIPSENVLTSLVTNVLNKEIVKKEYFKEIQSAVGYEKLMHHEEAGQKGLLQVRKERKNDLSFFEIKDIVQRKWWQEDDKKQQERKNRALQLEQKIQATDKKHKKLLLESKKVQILQKSQHPQNSLVITPEIQQVEDQLLQLKKQLTSLQSFSQEAFLSQQLAYHPHLIFYIRRNKGRFLLKLNKDSLYKHGWKNQVNWGPIRESIAASILHQSRMLQAEEYNGKEIPKVKIWDPMCGSGTFGLVAATMLEQIPVRSNVQKLFEWVHWPVYKKEFLEEYWKQKQVQRNEKKLNYQLILSDKDRQTINYSIDNFRLMVEGAKKEFESKNCHPEELFPSKTNLSQTLQIVPGKVGFTCGDFEQVMQLLKNPKNSTEQPTPLTIITNLPYVHSRSKEKYPLNQLTSIYRRFSDMVKQNSQMIDNVFVILDKNFLSKYHFLNISDQKWNLIGEYTSGGLEIGLYAWENNKIKPKFEENQLLASGNAVIEYEKIKGEISSEDRELILKKEKSVEKSLIEYRKKLSEIDRKYYSLPKHLMKKDFLGWKRVMEKRRRRHLLTAYELFARRRDKLIALKQYARQKLEIKMMRRGSIWKSKNLRFFNHSQEKLSEYSQEIKEIFEKKIEEALKKQEEYQERKKIKSGDKIEIAKIKNKWNADEKKMVKQIKYSKGKETGDKKYSRGRAKNSGRK